MKKIVLIIVILQLFFAFSCKSVDPKKVPKFVFIKGGHFTIGSNQDPRAEEYPQTWVFVDNFYISKYEITNEQYKYFLDDSPHWRKSNIQTLIKKKLVDEDYLNHWKNGSFPEKLRKHPITFVSWFACVAYCNWLSNLIGKKIRLPGEAEWEYAAGNGKKHTFYSIYPIKKADLTFANNQGPGQMTRPVGSHRASEFGLHDMTGNVWEYTMSRYRPYPFKANKVNDMRNTQDFERFTIRGGGFNTYLADCRVTVRNNFRAHMSKEDIGMRVVYTK